MAQGRWQDALDLNAEALDSKRRRGASSYELAYFAFNDYAPLIRLGRLPEADRLLRDCQDQFEAAGDTASIGKVVAARADLADKQGHPDVAMRHLQVALRYLYAGGDARTIAAGHYNLAGHLEHAGAAPEIRLAHRLTAALLHRLTGADHDLQRDLHAVVRDLTDPAAAAALPSTVERIQATVEQVDGVHLAALLDALEPDPTRQQATLDELLRSAHTIPADQAFEVDEHLATWNRSRRLARHAQTR
jgi:tetratricopeptide (TPR) repeat protein